VGVGDCNGRSAVGVVDGDMKATFLCTSTVIAVVVVIVGVGFVVGFEGLLWGVGSGGWGIGVRVEDTTLSSAGLGLGVGKVGKWGCVGVVEELAVEEDSAGSRGGGWSIDGSCPEDISGNGLKDLTEVGVALINGVGGQSGRRPSWGIFSLLSPFSLSLCDPSLNLLKRKAFMVFSGPSGRSARVVTRPLLSGVSGEGRRTASGESGDGEGVGGGLWGGGRGRRSR